VPADDLELAASLMRDAGQLAARMLRDGLTVHHKTSISDVVSAADHAAEELVVSRLRAERPADGIVGEEGTAVPGTGRTWFVDPVDGTYNCPTARPIPSSGPSITRPRTSCGSADATTPPPATGSGCRRSPTGRSPRSP
jgi:fructose-1,6-bisphosphatase/inositol monophosphatase family enzyme